MRKRNKKERKGPDFSSVGGGEGSLWMWGESTVTGRAIWESPEGTSPPELGHVVGRGEKREE